MALNNIYPEPNIKIVLYGISFTDTFLVNIYINTNIITNKIKQQAHINRSEPIVKLSKDSSPVLPEELFFITNANNKPTIIT